MPNPKYGKGDRFEKRVMVLLAHQGYVCWQARGSKGLADLIAVKPGQLLLVQCKASDGNGGRLSTASHDGWNGLCLLARDLSCVGKEVLPIWADLWPAAKGVRLRKITGLHVANQTTWPCVDWQPDELDAAVERLTSKPSGLPVIRPYRGQDG